MGTAARHITRISNEGAHTPPTPNTEAHEAGINCEGDDGGRAEEQVITARLLLERRRQSVERHATCSIPMIPQEGGWWWWWWGGGGDSRRGNGGDTESGMKKEEAGSFLFIGGKKIGWQSQTLNLTFLTTASEWYRMWYVPLPSTTGTYIINLNITTALICPSGFLLIYIWFINFFTFGSLENNWVWCQIWHCDVDTAKKPNMKTVKTHRK